jgi:hypothetical protein
MAANIEKQGGKNKIWLQVLDIYVSHSTSEKQKK